MGEHIREMLVLWKKVRQLGHTITGRQVTLYTLLEEWIGMTESIYNYLWEVVVPTLLREIDYEALYAKLMTQHKQALDDALKFFEDHTYLLRYIFLKMHFHLFQTMTPHSERFLERMVAGSVLTTMDME
ncbi:hypothetical protein Adt_10499 [Abeliophyllum distichum]|uniref:Cullin N-terminal domain-containing protein n=1 Tax=Abeliophyllum distichum TaxID=126358 RepID=A0ABD1UKE5_9LAMI